MVEIDLTNLSVNQLLNLHGKVLDELKTRSVISTRNNPVGDYTVWLVAHAFNLQPQPNSKKGFDAIDSNGVRFQIKGRRLDPANPSRQMSVIRNFDDKLFD